MTTYGYKPPAFGTVTPNQRALVNPQTTLASALAGSSPLATKSAYGSYTPPTVSAPKVTAAAPAAPNQTGGANVTPTGHPQNTAPTPGTYDLNADPVLQQIQAFAGMGDQEAQAAALKSQKNLLLDYGDPTLASAVLGAEDPTVQAAAANPTSIIANLAMQRGRNMTSLEDQLNAANLFYSGYRINQEQQADQDYQQALAGAAGNAQSGLDTIAGNLAQALAGNQQQRLSGLQDAYARAIQAALANPPVGVDAAGNPLVGGGADGTGAAPASGAGSLVGQLALPNAAPNPDASYWQLLGLARPGVPVYQ